MQFKDYYSILGLQQTASTEQIKYTFHMLALKYHPDKNPLDPTTCDKFKEILEASKVLINPEKRKSYDENFVANKNAQSSKERVCKSYSSQKRKTYKNPTSPSSRSKTKRNSQNVNKDIPYRTIMHVSLEDAFRGATIILLVLRKRVPVMITPGTTSGKVITYYGLLSGRTAKIKRDLIVTIMVDRHPVFEHSNYNLIYNLKINLRTALYGGKKDIKTIDKKCIRLNIPEGTYCGTLLRLKGQGFPIHSDSNLRGDLFVKIFVQLPKKLTKLEKKLYEQLAVLRKTTSS